MSKAGFTDNEKAFDLMVEVRDGCDGDLDCLRMGSGWSHIILANAILMIFLFCNLGCIVMGRIKAKWRLMASYVGFALALAHLGIIVAAAIYRFRPAGALCSLIEGAATNAPTQVKADLNDDWTYEKDGSLILALWVLQLIGAPMCCVLASL